MTLPVSAGPLLDDESAELAQLRASDPELYAAAMSSPEGCAPAHEPTPEERAQDLETLKALAERRKTTQSQLVQSWNSLPEHTRVLVCAAGAAIPPQAEARFDGQLAAKIARKEKQVWSLRLRGLLPARPRPARSDARARERRTAPPRRRSRTGTSLAGKDPPPDDPDDLAPPAAAGRRFATVWMLADALLRESTVWDAIDRALVTRDESEFVA